MRMFVCICFFLLPLRIAAQTNVFARVTLDRHSVYVQQPFKATFTVVTTTWYTAPLQFDNLQVNDAFIVPFTHSVPGQYEMNGSSLSGVQFYYMVFPYKPGSFTLPAMAITAESPAEGSTQGRKITVHTAPVSFTVKPVPPQYPSGHEWLVARDVALADHWSKPLDDLKVGDVLERTVTIDAQGTLPQLIPEARMTEDGWANVYPKPTVLKDTRDDVNPNGERTEQADYLLLKAGTFTIPAVEVYWWNPYAGRLFKRSTPARTIRVKENPGLGMLATLKDSLAAASPPVASAHKGPYRVMGLPWYMALLYTVAGVLLIWLLVKCSIRLYREIRILRARYLQSERYRFKQFIKADAASPELLRRLYQWWDRFASPRKTVPGSPALHDYLQEMYARDQIETKKGAALKKEISMLRKQWKRSQPAEKEILEVSEDQRPWPE